jgi:hypothetical protein
MVAIGDRLEDLAAAADRGEAPPASSPGIPQLGLQVPAPAADLEREKWIGGARRFCGMGRGMFSVLQAEWTDEKIEAFAVALADCAKHYNWKFGGLISHPLVALAGAGGVLAWPIARPIAMPYIDAALKKLTASAAGAQSSAGEGERTDQATPAR